MPVERSTNSKLGSGIWGIAFPSIQVLLKVNISKKSSLTPTHCLLALMLLNHCSMPSTLSLHSALFHVSHLATACRNYTLVIYGHRFPGRSVRRLARVERLYMPNKANETFLSAWPFWAVCTWCETSPLYFFVGHLTLKNRLMSSWCQYFKKSDILLCHNVADKPTVLFSAVIASSFPDI